jgi:hypothetical protein
MLYKPKELTYKQIVFNTIYKLHDEKGNSRQSLIPHIYNTLSRFDPQRRYSYLAPSKHINRCINKALREGVKDGIFYNKSRHLKTYYINSESIHFDTYYINSKRDI